MTALRRHHCCSGNMRMWTRTGDGAGRSDKFNVRLTAGPQNAGQIGEASFAAEGDVNPT